MCISKPTQTLLKVSYFTINSQLTVGLVKEAFNNVWLLSIKVFTFQKMEKEEEKFTEVYTLESV